MEELQARHRKELRDLQSQITQKKKQASKKTRKAVNDECERLDQDLKERQAREVAEVNGESALDHTDGGEELPAEELEKLTLGEAEDKTSNGTDAAPAAITNGSAHPVSGGGGDEGAGKKRNRAKERLARRAVEQEAIVRQAKEEAQNLPDMKEQERERMLQGMSERGLVEKEIRADGHCLYTAFADQLEQLEIPLGGESPSQQTGLGYKTVRLRAAEYIQSHEDDFVPFLEEPLVAYLHKVRDTGEWGGQLELLALAKTYGTDIHVLQDFGRVEKIEGGGGAEKTVWLGYYKHGFGLGEHYNSLRKKRAG